MILAVIFLMSMMLVRLPRTVRMDRLEARK
jgi:hypothetical protein